MVSGKLCNGGVQGLSADNGSSDDGWVDHPLHPTRARMREGKLEIEQTLDRRVRFGPLLSVAVMVWLRDHTSWDGDDAEKIWWSSALTVLGDWSAQELGPLQLVCGGDGRPGLRRHRSDGRIANDLRSAWRGTRAREPWFDVGTSGVIPMVLHYQPVADSMPLVWAEVQAMVASALEQLTGRNAYQLARVLGAIPDPAGACVYCGSLTELTLDHAIPLDGAGHPWGDNLVVACHRCNAKKGALDLSDWIASLPSVHDLPAVEAASQTRGLARPKLQRSAG
jgi:hypothetical protein